VGTSASSKIHSSSCLYVSIVSNCSSLHDFIKPSTASPRTCLASVMPTYCTICSPRPVHDEHTPALTPLSRGLVKALNLPSPLLPPPLQSRGIDAMVKTRAKISRCCASYFKMSYADLVRSCRDEERIGERAQV
jgi:hypothetical protein